MDSNLPHVWTDKSNSAASQDEGEDEAEVCALCCQKRPTITVCGECHGHECIDVLKGIILFLRHVATLNSANLPYAACFVGKVCGPLWSTWGASLGEGKSGFKVGIVDTNVACRVRAEQTPPLFMLQNSVPHNSKG